MAVVQISSSSSSLSCFLNSNKASAIRDWKTHNHHLSLSCCSKQSTALKLFDEIPKSNDTFAWNNIVQTHLTNRDFEFALLIYPQMLLRGVRPDRHTLPRILTAASRCNQDDDDTTTTTFFFYAKQIHGHALKFGFASDHYVITALMALYGHYDGAQAARRLLLFHQSSSLPNSVSWTLLLRLYITQGNPSLAIQTFQELMMLHMNADAVALATVLGACGSLKSLQQGRKIHDLATTLGLHFNVLVTNSLLKMYIDCGSIKDARMVFNQMTSKDVISWTLIIHWYVKNGEFNEALKLFRLMNSEGVKPDSVSVSGILPACARIAAGKNGKEIHAYTLRNKLHLDQAVQNSLMDMYIKSGFLDCASKIFGHIKDKDVISLTVLILGYSLHGQGESGLDLFHKMKKNMHKEIDDTTYDAVLRACNTACLVEEGKSIFKCIREPKVEHCSLMVSLLARARLFDEAKAFIEEHHFEWNAQVQRALLDGCRIYREKKMAKRIVERLTEIEPLNPDTYVILSNLYAAFAQWDIVKSLGETIRDMGLKPRRAYSWIEVKNKVHVFEAGDVSHPRSEKIYHELQILLNKIQEEEGYILDTDFSLHDVDLERECIPIGHSEMLAISFGLISTQQQMAIRLTKNLRVCRSCHSIAKMISKAVGREIILKDPGRFHHFKDGVCSCNDFW